MFNIALYQPDIPQNTAAIIRLCSCFGTTLEIIEPCGFHLNDKRIKKLGWKLIVIWECKLSNNLNKLISIQIKSLREQPI